MTPEQIEAMALPTAPAKAADKRAFEGETCQAEAIAPDDLAGITSTSASTATPMPKCSTASRRSELALSSGAGDIAAP